VFEHHQLHANAGRANTGDGLKNLALLDVSLAFSKTPTTVVDRYCFNATEIY